MAKNTYTLRILDKGQEKDIKVESVLDVNKIFVEGWEKTWNDDPVGLKTIHRVSSRGGQVNIDKRLGNNV